MWGNGWTGVEMESICGVLGAVSHGQSHALHMHLACRRVTTQGFCSNGHAYGMSVMNVRSRTGLHCFRHVVLNELASYRTPL
jgi:hypothetical protein